MLCLCTACLVERTRLTVHKQSLLNLLRQNGRRVTKVYCNVEKKNREESENRFSW